MNRLDEIEREAKERRFGGKYGMLKPGEERLRQAEAAVDELVAMVKELARHQILDEGARLTENAKLIDERDQARADVRKLRASLKHQHRPKYPSQPDNCNVCKALAETDREEYR